MFLFCSLHISLSFLSLFHKQTEYATCNTNTNLAFPQFPRELDARLGRNLTATDIERFAREDPKIRRHLDVVRRKELLEHVLKEIEGLRQLEDRERRYAGKSPVALTSARGDERRGWRLF